MVSMPTCTRCSISNTVDSSPMPGPPPLPEPPDQYGYSSGEVPWTNLASGTRVTLRHFKLGDRSARRTGVGFVRSSTSSTIEVFVPNLTASAPYDGSTFNTYTDAVYRFDRWAWYNIIEYEDGGRHWYCNIATPAHVEGRCISWIDLDIDVEFFADGTWWIADIPEFTDRCARYPEDVIHSALDAVRALVERFVDQEPPFDATPGDSGGYSCYDHVFWSSPQVGDGVAVVDPMVASSTVATRSLQGFAPGSVLSADDLIDAVRHRSIPPSDGLLVVGSDDLPVDVIRRARVWADALALSKLVHIVIVRGKPLNPLVELEVSVRADSEQGRLLRDLNSAILKVSGAAPAIASGRDMVAAGWF